MSKTLSTCLALGVALAASAASLDDYAFLVKYMPEKDRGTVSEAYLRKNVALAQEARKTAPWRETITDEIYREYILPYSSIGEEVDDWRPLFREKFWPIAKTCKTTGEAVALINSKIWDMLDVHYNTKRDKPDQSPFHSMRIHMASCTGLAIIQVDVYRACGIPARFTGCNWTPIPGNHSWVEYYDNGTWHFFNDAESGKIQKADEAWYRPYAAMADGSNPRTKIYAARWSPNKDNLRFWLTWRGGDRPSTIFAEEVTANYARYRAALPESRIGFVARDKSGQRQAVEFRLIAPGSGKVMAKGKTFDETHDMNDHFVVSLPEHTMAIVAVKQKDGSFKAVGYTEYGSKQKTFTIELK